MRLAILILVALSSYWLGFKEGKDIYLVQCMPQNGSTVKEVIQTTEGVQCIYTDLSLRKKSLRIDYN